MDGFEWVGRIGIFVANEVSNGSRKLFVELLVINEEIVFLQEYF